MKLKELVISILAIFVALLSIAGCAAVGQRLDPPRISLANIRVQEVSGNNMLPTTLPFESEGQVTLMPTKGQP